MSEATTKKQIEGIWLGHLQGTNRGKVLVRITSHTNGLTAKAILYDDQLGITEARLSGRLSDGRTEFRLLEAHGVGQFVPRDGRVILNLKEDGSADGEWQTDIGTSGLFRIFRANFGTIGSYWRILSAKASFGIQNWLPSIYGFFLITIAIISIIRTAKISSPALILLLVPVPFVFRSQLANLIGIVQRARIKRLGPIEFDQNPPTTEIIAAATQQAHENVAFAQLNQFFALRTKIILAILAHGNGMSVADFGQLARSLGVPEENVETTLLALLQTKCVQVVEDRIIATQWGHRYVQTGLWLG